MKVVDLFCGCGGLSLGFEQAGFDVVAGIDNWDAALDVYRLNFDHAVRKADLMDVDKVVPLVSSFMPDMIVGGPPCQDYSSAGSRDENGGRAILTVRYAEVVARVRPAWFVMENVSNILKYSKVFEAMDIFHESGYGLSYRVLDASLCGVPQKRKRFFMVGKIGEKDGFFDAYLEKNLSKKEMTMRDYFGSSLGIDAYYRHPRSYARRGIFSMDEPSPTVRGVNRPMPKGYRLHKNDPVCSLENIRPLTTLERAEVQTFPSDFIWIGNKTNVEQMIGNAVPVNLAKHVGLAIKDYIFASEQKAENHILLRVHQASNEKQNKKIHLA